ncbi:MAG TPA: acyl-CoA dehydrogenase family protein, partial [Candidatus Cloacimonadota bacterium]|nr:acyl-CoA dehydrogenase family protein [Candidatus Cloacimonadota bacterium]
MNFNLSKSHEMAQKLFREFSIKEVKPLAQETDEQEKFPLDTVKKMARYGIMGIPFPKEIDG